MLAQRQGLPESLGDAKMSQRDMAFGLQGDLNLNICEAHAFNTSDRYSLDVFVVNGWSGEVQPIRSLSSLPCSLL